MTAREIAEFAHVKLEDLSASATESQPVISQGLGESLPGQAIKFRR